MNRKIVLAVIIIFLAVGSFVGYNYYQKIYSENVVKSGFLYIGSKANSEDTEKQLSQFVKNIDDFNWVARLKKMKQIRPGRYQLAKGMTNNDLANLLRSGKQAAVKVSFNNQNTLEKLAGRIATQIEADSLSLLNAFRDKKFISQQGISDAQTLQLFIPNTYEFFWNTTAEQFRERMVKEYNRFWNANRKAKAKALNMTPSEVITLASIVQKETAKVVERPTVAGMYVNRLKLGMLLQADPTVVYMLKQKYGQDFVVKRVLYKDLKIESPYNTYLNKGLPPSLIAMPDISSIDAVLNYEKHQYLYMCVNIDKIGYHTFSKGLREHNRNASRYHRWLNKQGIRR